MPAPLRNGIFSLTAHSPVQTDGVWIVLGSALLGATELCSHCLIGPGKGEGKFGYMTDQGLNLAYKLAYVIVLVRDLVAADRKKQSWRIQTISEYLEENSFRLDGCMV